MFQFTSYEPFSVARIPQLIALGVICGFVSLYFTRGMNFLEVSFRKVQSPVIKLLIGGIALGVLIFVFPTVLTVRLPAPNVEFFLSVPAIQFLERTVRRFHIHQ